jgi:hypothetical protein
MSYSVDLLQKELETLNRAKAKSKAAFSAGRIKKEKHQEHLNNLNPKILDLEVSINLLLVK